MKEILITSSALILALLLLRRVFQKVLSRRFQYALWALVLVRLLVPFSLPAADFSILTTTEPVRQAVTTRLEQAVPPITVQNPAQLPAQLPNPQPNQIQPVEPVSGNNTISSLPQEGSLPQQGNESPASSGLTLGQVLTLVWTLGMVLMGGFFLLSNLSFYLRLRRARQEFTVPEAMALSLRRKVYLVPGTLIPSPCLFGNAIYITPAVAENEHKLRHVLAHEETHAKHLDPLWSLLRCVCLTVYWFDPLVWIAAHCSKMDCELACDESVLAALGEQERIPYGQTLLSLIPVKHLGNPMLAATTMTAGKKALKDRVQRIAKGPRQLVAAALAVALLAGMVSACTFTAAKPSATPEPEGPQALTGEELRWFNREFFNGPEQDEYGFSPYNIRNQFVNGPFNTYDRPQDIDLFELFYCEPSVNSFSDAELKTVLGYDNWYDMPCGAYKLTTAEMNELLKPHTGFTLEETNKVGLEKFIYSSEFDAYYWMHGDTNYPGDVEMLSGTREGSTVKLYHHGWSSGSNWFETTLEEQKNGGYRFVSNKACDKPIIPTPLPDRDPAAVISLAELEPYVTPTITPEMHNGDLSTRIDGYRLSGGHTLRVYSASDSHTYAAMELENEGYNVFLDLTDCAFSLGSFSDLFGHSGFTISYSGPGLDGEYHGTWVDYYIVSDDGVPALLLRSDDEWGTERVMDLDGNGADELATRSAVFFAREGLIYRADIEELLLSACPEFSVCNSFFWDPYGKYCTAVASDNGDLVRTYWRHLYFDGENLLVYKDDKTATDHVVDGIADNVPEAVLAAAKHYVQQVYDAGETGQVLKDGDFVFAPVTFDDWRVTSITKGSQNRFGNLVVEGWQFNYELHTTTPETLSMAGARHLTEDDWTSPGYPGCDWLFFQVEGEQYTYLWKDIINDMGPKSYLWEPYLEKNLNNMGLLKDVAYYQVQQFYDRIIPDEQFTMTLLLNGSMVGSYPAGGWNAVSSLTEYTNYQWEMAEAPDIPKGTDELMFSRDGLAIHFYDYQGLVECREGDTSHWYRALQITDHTYDSVYHFVRRWYDETEWEALTEGIAIPGDGRSRNEIARAWVETYEGAYLKASPGSSMGWSFMKVINCEEYKGDEPFVQQLDENTFPFSWSTIFVPEVSDGGNFMAGNTDYYQGSDPEVPAGALQWWHCGYLHLDEDGFWRCDGGGTGW